MGKNLYRVRAAILALLSYLIFNLAQATTEENVSSLHCGCLDEVSTPLLKRLEPQRTTNVARSGGSGNTTEGFLIGQTRPVASRWVTADAGEPVRYVVDAQFLPAGITQSQALTAVSQALQAWSQATQISFVFDSTENLTQAASTLSRNDRKLYLQLHDNFNAITTSGVLGTGGFRSTNNSNLLTTGGAGGQVSGLEFDRITIGYIVLEHTNPSLQNLSLLTQIITHELGHALGFAHSSDDANETNMTKRDATMYYRAQTDGRGASLRTYDTSIAQRSYPTTGVPWATERKMRILTHSSIPNEPSLNEIRLLYGDRQTAPPNLSLLLGPKDLVNANNSFTLTGDTLRFVPAATFSTSTEITSDTSYYAVQYYRVSDGTHCSAWERVRVVSYSLDTFPSTTTDGLPDNWMTQVFGNASPAAGTSRGPNDDFDGDGWSNLQEYQIGTSPTDARSALAISTVTATQMSWPTVTGSIYEIEASNDLRSWQRQFAPIIPTGPLGTQTLPALTAAERLKFYRVRPYR